MTQHIIECLRSQKVEEPLNIIVIDDGSTDGTGAYLSEQSDLTVLTGDGSLWWGGGIDLALKHVFPLSDSRDWVLFVNNDTEIRPDFVQTLLHAAQVSAPSAVGSVILDEEEPHGTLSFGACIDAWRLEVGDIYGRVGHFAPSANSLDVIEVDALSGRGVLFPIAVLKDVKGMRPRWLPHYLADYELSLRVKSAGYRLVVALGAAVYSSSEFGGHSFRATSVREKFFSVRSPSYLPAVLIFWWEASNWLQRLTFPLRVVLFKIFPSLRKMSV